MKNLLVLLFILPFCTFCQTDSIPRNAEGKYEYTEVVKVDAASADKLYSNAKLFIVDAFKSGKDVTQLNDDNTRTVAGQGSFKINYKGINSAIVDYTVFRISIQCKDGKYKYIISQFAYHSDGRIIPLEDDKNLKHYMTNKMKAQFTEQTYQDSQNLIGNLKKHMAANPQDF